MFDKFKIKSLIIGKGFTIKEFVKYVKINEMTFYNMINNVTEPQFGNVLKIAIALDCKIDDLLQKEVK